MNGIKQTVTGMYFFNIYIARRSYYRGGFKSLSDAWEDKQIYEWAEFSLKLRRQIKGKRVAHANKVHLADVNYYSRGGK